jgi:hypothetical protein
MSFTSPLSTPPWIAAPTGDDLVRVDALVRVLADQLLDLVDDRGHARHAADEDDVVDLRLVHAGVLEALLGRADRARQAGRRSAR